MKGGVGNRLAAKAIYGPMQEKTLHNLLKRELVFNFGYDNKLRIADVLIETFLQIVEEYGKLRESLVPLQVLWPAVDKEDFPGYGKRMSQIKHNTIVLTLWTDEEIEKLSNGIPIKELQGDRIARICKEAYSQGCLLSMTDIGLLMNISASAASHARRNWEKIHGESLPTRGSYHDLGQSLTHKRQIIEDHLRGLLPSEISRKHKHEITSVNRYIRDFERTLPMFEAGYSINKIVFYTGMSKRLVKEYYRIYKESYERKIKTNSSSTFSHPVAKEQKAIDQGSVKQT